MKQLLSILVICMMISITPVYALRISEVRVTGQDGVDGYVRQEDTITFSVLIDGVTEFDAPVLRSLLRFRGYHGQFSACTGAGEGVFRCTYTEQINAGASGLFVYILDLYNQWGNPVQMTGIESSVEGTYYVDRNPPTLSVQMNQQGGVFVAQGVASDTAFTNNPPNVCSGIASIELVRQGTILASINPSERTCLYPFEMTINSSVLGTGTHTMCVQTRDKMGFSAQQCSQVTIDLTPPQIGAIELYDEHAIPLRFVGNTPRPGYVSVSISDGTGIQNVEVTINGEQIDVSCSGSTTTVSCRSEQRVYSQGSYTIGVVAYDTSGNTAQRSAGVTITQDTQPPIVQLVDSGATHQNMPLLGDGSSISITFNEQESGLGARNVYLILPNSNVIRADTCQRANQWVCRWDGLPLTGISNGATKIGLINSRDDAGNFAVMESGESPIFDVFVWNTPPQGKTGESYAFSGQQRIEFGYSFAPMLVNVTYDSPLPVKGTADFSAFGGSTVTVDCVNGSCLFRSGQLGEGPVVGEVIVTLEDAAGNRAFYMIPAELLKTTEGDVVNWQHRYTLSPPAVDRSTAQMITNTVYAQVVLSSPSRAEIVDIALDSCRSRSTQGGIIEGNRDPQSVFNPQGDIEFVQEYELVDMGDATNTHQFLRFALKAVSYQNVDKLDLTCNLIIISRRGDLFFPREVQQINVTIPMYSFAAGSLGESYQQELDAAIDATGGLLNTIASFERFVEMIRMLCRIYESIVRLLASIQLLTQVFGSTSDMLLSIPIIGPAVSQHVRTSSYMQCQGETAATNQAVDSWGNIVSTFCEFVNCRKSLTSFGLGLIGDDLSAGFQDIQKSLYEYSGGALIDRIQRKETTFDEHEAFFGTEDSLFWSVINLCIPGIIKNLNEYRQIQCRYAVCLRDDVPQGVPKQACDSTKSYMTCKYIYGQIFSTIPFVAFMDQQFNKIKEIFSTPTGIIGAIGGIACNCEPILIPVFQSWSQTSVCKAYRVLVLFGDVINSVMSIISPDFWKMRGEDVCKQL